MSQFNTPTYDIERPTGQCAFTGQALEPGDTYIATLVELPQDEQAAPSAGKASGGTSGGGSGGLKRVDVAYAVWEQGHRPDRLFSFWKSVVPPPNQKKKVFVDDQVLMNLLKRLADTDQPQRLAFRFVLALILMRKKQLRYDRSFIKETLVAPPAAEPAPESPPESPPESSPESLVESSEVLVEPEGQERAAAREADGEVAPEAAVESDGAGLVVDALPTAEPVLVQQEWWVMTPKGEDEPLEILNPQLDDAQIQQVTQQLGEILEGEL